MIRSNRMPGFTLVELLLFTGIIGMMVGALVGVSLVSSDLSGRSESRVEVEQNGNVVIQRIIQELENTDFVVYPEPGQSSEVLVLSSMDPNEREVIIHRHHGRVRMIENTDEVTLLTTNDVNINNLRFLHRTDDTGGSVSFVFQAENEALGTSVARGQYSQNFRASVNLQPDRCTQNSDCISGTCCSGICRANCLTGCTPGSCTDTNICCITDIATGAASCTAPAACTNAACLIVDDCPVTTPYFLVDGSVVFCDLTTCEYKVPTCTDANICSAVSIGPCDVCSQCGDGETDIAAGEECDDGNIINSDECTNACKIPECGDGIIKDPVGVEVCNNSTDDDGDSDIDCADTDCPDGTSCGANGRVCSGASCVCPGGTSPEILCIDSVDNDCDGNSDCDDSDCDSDPACAGTCGNWLLEGAEECDDGNTDSGDGCSDVCMNEGTCASCTPCGTSAVKWYVELSGVTNSSCGTCNDMNKEFELIYDCTHDLCTPCEPCWSGGGDEATSCTYEPFVVYYNVDHWELTNMDVVYTHDGVGWNCLGSNVFNYSSDIGECSNWPAQATVTSLGVIECIEVTWDPPAGCCGNPSCNTP